MKIVLASQSPRRRELIKEISTDVEFMAPEVDESLIKEDDPISLAVSLAKTKALDCLERFKSNGQKSLVLGCDTIVTLDGKIYGKPKDKEQAFEMLSELSGKTHTVITGVCFAGPNGVIPLYDKTQVTFNPLTDSMINEYISTGDPLDKAGAYGIQNLPDGFVKEIIGDYNNVVGLPVELIKSRIDKAAEELFKSQ